MLFVETTQNFAGDNLAEDSSCAIDSLVVVFVIILLVEELYSVDEQTVNCE